MYFVHTIFFIVFDCHVLNKKFSFSSTINITDNGSGRGRCIQFNWSRADGGECGLGRMLNVGWGGAGGIPYWGCKSNLCGADLEGGGASKR